MSEPIVILITTCVSFTTSLLIIWWLIRLSHRHKWYDDVDHRKIHSGDIPRIGGLGIFIAFFIGLLVFFIISAAGRETITTKSLLHYLPLFGGFCIILAAGLADDFSNLRARYKFLFQLVAAILVAGFGFVYKEFSILGMNFSFSLGIFSYVFTVFWIVGMSNAVNLIDGMDGLAGGIACIASLFFGVISIIQGDYILAVFSLTLFGSTVGFLVYNFPPAKLFMGDSGSLFLGFVIAVFPLLKRGGPSSTISLIAVFSLLLIPILDTFEAIVRRSKNRVAIHSADQSHLHHKLIRLGLSNIKILIIIYSLSVVTGISCIIWVVLGEIKLIFPVLGTWVVFCLFFVLIDILNRRKNGGKETRINDVHKRDGTKG